MMYMYITTQKMPQAALKSCPEGKVRNPATGRCIKAENLKAATKRAAKVATTTKVVTESKSYSLAKLNPQLQAVICIYIDRYGSPCVKKLIRTMDDVPPAVDAVLFNTYVSSQHPETPPPKHLLAMQKQCGQGVIGELKILIQMALMDYMFKKNQEPKPASPKPASRKPASPKPASRKPASPKPASRKPASPKVTHKKKPQHQSGRVVASRGVVLEGDDVDIYHRPSPGRRKYAAAHSPEVARRPISRPASVVASRGVILENDNINLFKSPTPGRRKYAAAHSTKLTRRPVA
jgi:hypothetical protein